MLSYMQRFSKMCSVVELTMKIISSLFIVRYSCIWINLKLYICAAFPNALSVKTEEYWHRNDS